MENKLQIFNHAEFGNIRTIEENGKLLFCGKDIASCLGYSNTKDAIIRHCKGVVKRDLGVRTGTKTDGTPTIQQMETAFLPEGDVYRLITRSKLPAAEKFERWVFDEVVPSVVNTGSYGHPNTTVLMKQAMEVMSCFTNTMQQFNVTFAAAVQAENAAQVVKQTEKPTPSRRYPGTKMDDLPPCILEKARSMLQTKGYTYQSISEMIKQNGESISQSTIARYARCNNLYPA